MVNESGTFDYGDALEFQDPVSDETLNAREREGSSVST